MVESKHRAGGSRLDYIMVGGGPGAFIGAVHKAANDLNGRSRLVGGCFSRNRDNNATQAKLWGIDDSRVYQDYNTLFEIEAKRPDKPAFAIIVTPNNTHYAAAKAALERGFNVACDKPLCLTPEEADELFCLSRGGNLRFMVTYTYTGYPMVRQAREMIRRGDLGEIRLVIGEYAQDWLSGLAEEGDNKQAAWRTDPAQSGIAGCMGDIGSHVENLAHFVTGLKMTSLAANLDTFVKGRRLDDNGFVWYRTENGAKGSIWASQVAIGRENGLTLRVYGEKGALEWQQENPNHLLFAGKGKPVEILTRGQGYLHAHAGRYTRLPTGHPEGLFEAFANLYDGFIQTILAEREGRDPGDYDLFPDVGDGARGVRFIHRVVASSRDGGTWLDVE